MKKLDVASWIFLGLALFGIVYGLDIASRHGLDQGWPPNARYHVVVGGIHVVVLSLVTAIMAGGLRRRRRSAWVTLAVVSLLGWAAWPIARSVAGEPPPGWVQLVTIGALAAAVVALAISFRPIFAGDSVGSRPSAPNIGE